MQPTQTRSNHAKLDPLYHFVIAPLLAAIVILSLFRLSRPSWTTVLIALQALGMFLLAYRTRTYSLKVQDRVIRLEERLRLATLLPGSMRTRVHDFSEGQLIALRFASDEELPALAGRALNENLSNKQIKENILAWRPDYFRV